MVLVFQTHSAKGAKKDVCENKSIIIGAKTYDEIIKFIKIYGLAKKHFEE